MWMNLRAIVAVCLIASAVSAREPSADDTGAWWFPDRSGQVEIYQQRGHLHGRVQSYRVSDQRDENDPDPELRERRFFGIDMIEGFQFVRETGRWEGGTIYDADSGRTYRGMLGIDPEDPETLCGSEVRHREKTAFLQCKRPMSSARERDPLPGAVRSRGGVLHRRSAAAF